MSKRHEMGQRNSKEMEHARWWVHHIFVPISLKNIVLIIGKVRNIICITI